MAVDPNAPPKNPPPNPYGPPDLSKPLPQFDLQRQQASQQGNAQKQTNQDALTREYSRLGGLNSGSYIKQTQINNDQSDQNQNQVNAGINANEAATKLALQQTQQAQQFQTSEREAGQQYQSGILGQQQEFQKGLQGQQLGQQQSQFQTTQDFNNRVQSFNQNSTLRQLDNAETQMSQDKASTEFNKLTSIMASPDWRLEQQGLRNMMNDPTVSQAMRDAAQNYLTGLGANLNNAPGSTVGVTYTPPDAARVATASNPVQRAMNIR